MAVFYIREFQDVGKAFMGNVAQAPIEPAGTGYTDRTLTISGAASLTSLSANAGMLVLIHTDAICSYKVGTASTVVATATNVRLAANTERYFVTSSNTTFISVITNT